MKLLALDTATEACSVSLAIGAARIDRYIELERGHAEQILPMVESVLAEGGIALGDLDAIAFGRGPGGFTGVRLAASVVQGLAYGAGLGVVPISNLAAVARQVAGIEPEATKVLVANDARMREVYWSHYALSTDDRTPRPSTDEQVSPPASVTLPTHAPGERWVAAGRGLRVWPELADRCRSAGALLHAELLPRAADILELARPLAERGQVLDPTQALPVYVRDRVAEPAM
jgi:tRNA threonylcarbamoyladenosine biosynthesis protein TsaB